MEAIISFITGYWQQIIAIIGLLLSLFNFIYLLKNNFKRIFIKEIFYTTIKMDDNYYYEFNIIIMNKSRQPISIVDVSFKNSNKIYSSKLDRTKIATYNEKKSDEVKYYSSEFPINLGSLESSKELLLFSLKEKLETEKIKVTIMTNRGKIRKVLNFQNKFIELKDYLDKIIKNG